MKVCETSRGSLCGWQRASPSIGLSGFLKETFFCSSSANPLFILSAFPGCAGVFEA